MGVRHPVSSRQPGDTPAGTGSPEQPAPAEWNVLFSFDGVVNGSTQSAVNGRDAVVAAATSLGITVTPDRLLVTSEHESGGVPVEVVAEVIDDAGVGHRVTATRI